MMADSVEVSPAAAPASGRATTTLVLGVLSILCCQFLGPVAWYLGNQELKAIASGASPVSGEGVTKAGKILGIIGTVLLAIVCLWILFMGGLAVLMGVMNGGFSQ
jgi:hypothetical protein